MAAYAHGAVAALYAVMIIWHSLSVLRHWSRQHE